MTPPPHRVEPLEVEVGSDAGLGSGVIMRGWIRGPDVPEPRAPVVYCLAGGMCSTGYFDLHIAGHDGYSMAEHLAANGIVVVALDHPGVGASDPVEDLFTITPTILAAAHAVAVRQVVGRLAQGTLVPGWRAPSRPFVVGLGHSMGAMIAGVVQARHQSFDALALLGHGTGLPALLTDDERAVSGPDLRSMEDRIAQLARLRFESTSGRRRRAATGSFFTDDVTSDVRAGFRSQMVPLLYTCGLTSMIPGATGAEKARVEAPTFFAFGDHDLTDDYVGAIAQYPSLTDVAMLILSPSGHCHNQSLNRRHLGDRLLAWTATVAPSATARVAPQSSAPAPTPR